MPFDQVESKKLQADKSRSNKSVSKRRNVTGTPSWARETSLAKPVVK